MKVDLRSVEFCGDSSTTNEARVMHRLFAVTVGASRYGRAERGGVMRRRCFNDESAFDLELSLLELRPFFELQPNPLPISSFSLSLQCSSRCNAFKSVTPKRLTLLHIKLVLPFCARALSISPSLSILSSLHLSRSRALSISLDLELSPSLSISISSVSFISLSISLDLRRSLHHELSDTNSSQALSLSPSPTHLSVLR
ncbi:unnamed protein product [Brassica oleracea]|uniref:(rape) hypothetical protein n=1 Tax=Brassica napus TaxID=3708 RepID=A0A816M0M4_BRANA|nr:unnamed protein product [Brassica napus]